MARYIDAEALERDLDKYYKPEHDGVKHWIQVQQTADVAPVVHGRWLECDYVKLDSHGFPESTPKAGKKCTNCKHGFRKDLLWKDNYCPNCGAKMDLEVQDG